MKHKRSTYTPELKTKIVNTIINLIEEEAISLRKALAQVKANIEGTETLGLTTVGDWLNEEENIEQYTRAREARADKIFEEILDIADKQGEDVTKDEFGNQVVNHNVINRNRLQIDARKWMLGKMQPKKYSDKLDVTTNGKEINSNISVQIVPPKDEE